MNFLARIIYSIISYIVFVFIGLGQIHAQDDDECTKLTRKMINDWYKECKTLIKTNPRYVNDMMKQAIVEIPTFVEAYYLLAEVNYSQAKKFMEEAQQTEKIEQLFNIAESYFKKVIELKPSFNSYQSYYYLGEYYYDLHQFAQARIYLEVFTTHNRIDCNFIDNADSKLKDIEHYFTLRNNPVPFSPKPIIGPNSDKDEYLPMISADGSLLFYTKRSEKPNATGRKVMVEEFWSAEKLNPADNSSDKYTQGKVLPAPFNQDVFNQGGATLTIDNLEMFLSHCKLERLASTSYKNCDIYNTRITNGKWSPLKKLGQNINGLGTWEAQPSITSDGNVLFFASIRDGGYGGIDIYRSVRDKAGNWGVAENLGPVINTAGDDKTPFIHSDSQTLYFSSNGRFGLGGFDIYYSHYLGNGNWSEPVNIGYPINQEYDDLAFVVSADGSQIYFASNKLKPEGDYDIYSSPLYEEARPKPVLFVHGNLSDPKGKPLTNAQVELQSVKTLKLTKGLVDAKTGRYAIAVAVLDKEDFIITVKSDSTFFASRLLKVTEKELSNIPITIDFELHPIEVGTNIKLENINFATNSAEFDDASIITLNNFLEFLQINPQLHISILGHTDSEGSDENNMQLSWRRAKAVRDFLVGHGIIESRLNFKGFGETRPIATNATAKGRALNRRTEFVVTVK